MNQIEYSALNYYHSPVSDECLCLGVLFHNVTTGQRDFRHISNFKRFQAFDDEANVFFVKKYLTGIKEDVEESLLNYNEAFDLHSYVRTFANEFKFSSIKKIKVNIDEDYVDELTKIYLKYDLPQNERLNRNGEKKLIRRILESNNLKYSSGVVCGAFNDEISFDYQLDDLCVKHFSFKEKNLKRLIGYARQWSFAASEIKGTKEVLFTYDSDIEDSENLKIIINILSKHAKVLDLDAGVEYMIQSCTN